jgi:hypothetical protein
MRVSDADEAARVGVRWHADAQRTAVTHSSLSKVLAPTGSTGPDRPGRA